MKPKHPLCKLVTGLAAFALTANVASAALVWDTPGIYSTLDDTSFQIYEQAANFNIGSATTGTTTWGEVWTNVNHNGGTVGGITLATTSGFKSSESLATLYPGGNAVLGSHMFALTGFTVTLTGLDADTKYLIQYLVADNRMASGDAFGNREQWFQQGAGNAADKVDPIGSTTPQFVVFGAEFTGGTSVAVTGQIGRATQGGSLPTINAVRVSVIPEPSAALLGGLAMLTLLRRRR